MGVIPRNLIRVWKLKDDLRGAKAHNNHLMDLNDKLLHENASLHSQNQLLINTLVGLSVSEK